MNKLDLERKKNRILYRELFFEADKTFKEQLNKFKNDFSCSKCGSCCKIRYSPFSPADIFELSKQEDVISQEYIKFFLPYGADEFFTYEQDNEIQIELNNKKALEADNVYVSSILTKSLEPVYFYYCRHNEENKCSCRDKSFLCNNFPNSVTTILPETCVFKGWQKLCVDKINNEIASDIYLKASEIQNYSHNFNCSRCATCCNLACSEFSYEELKIKALKGDEFAKQFTSIFIPYKTLDEAREIFPDYVDLVKQTMDEDESIYFYHCPHLAENNDCSIYEKRPGICKDFPDNPLCILPPTCGFHEWKEEVMVASMTLHAMTYIYKFYLEKIEAVL